MTPELESKLEEIYNVAPVPFDKDAKALIRRAFEFAEIAHEGQKRKSGEPYFYHLVETAKNLSSLGMRKRVIAAGLLHDAVEDGMASEESVEKTFGKEIAELVDGVTKLGKVRYQGMRRHNESLRKFFIASAKDIRVIIIKLADRLHNMQTLDSVREDKRERIAIETLEIYAPLAYRLGISTLSRQLEDLAFPYVYPEAYKKTRAIMKERSKQTLAKLEKIDRSIKRKLAENHIRDFHTSRRVKGMYSLYKKLERKKWDTEKIYDIAALRIIVPDKPACYQVLGIIHQNYRPMPGRIKDYIAFEKPNGYQSIHTTIFTGDGGLVEIQIRTEEMHNRAEYGAASHLGYKSATGSLPANIDSKDQSWVAKLLHRFISNRQARDANDDATIPDWLSSLAANSDEALDSEQFEQKLKEDFFSHRIFVFTPVGAVIDLPQGSTPIDFAYLVHSEIGHHTAGAKIGGKLVSLDTPLRNGDIVEIITKPHASPSAKWLEFTKSTEARRKIRSHLAKQQHKNVKKRA
ncbi:MAG: RelA/SpoT family protein [Patescibacteria group bacterium]